MTSWTPGEAPLRLGLRVALSCSSQPDRLPKNPTPSPPPWERAGLCPNFPSWLLVAWGVGVRGALGSGGYARSLDRGDSGGNVPGLFTLGASDVRSDSQAHEADKPRQTGWPPSRTGDGRGGGVLAATGWERRPERGPCSSKPASRCKRVLADLRLLFGQSFSYGQMS